MKFPLLSGLILFSICQFFMGCQKDSEIGTKIQLDPLIAYFRTDTSFKFEKNKSNTKETLLPPSQIPTTRDELTAMRTIVKILNGKQHAGITIPGFGGVVLGKDESSLSVYFVETKLVDTSIYGIGYSFHYLFRKIKRGISITNLPDIAASVQLENNKTQVMYSLQSYGIKSLSLVNYFKPTVNKDFNVEGFGIMQSAIDGIHNVLSDSLLSSKTKFEPMHLPFIKVVDVLDYLSYNEKLFENTVAGYALQVK